MQFSEGTKAITKAMGGFLKACPSPELDGTNPHFKSRYTTLGNLIDTVTPHMIANDLVYTQGVSVQDGQQVMVTRITHAASGEWFESAVPFVSEKSTAQAIGSGVTYARRYGLLTALGIVGDDDDDGNAATTKTAASRPTIIGGDSPYNGRTEKKQWDNSRPVDYSKMVGPATAAQIRLLNFLADDVYTLDKESKLKQLVSKVTGGASTSVAALTKGQASQLIDGIQKRKAELESSGEENNNAPTEQEEESHAVVDTDELEF